MTARTGASAVAEALIRCNGVTFRTEPFFTLTSGAQSPVYVDNRQMLGHVIERQLIVQALVDAVDALPEIQAVGATATAGIPWGAWVADRLELPLLYVRAEAKSWGKERAVEGIAPDGSHVLVVEDLAFTAGSLVAAAANLRDCGYRVEHALTILSYNTPTARRQIAGASLQHRPLATIDDALLAARQQGTLDDDQAETVNDWLETLRTET